jgi:hypothetical protein
MNVFLAGIMQGSKTDDAIHDQNWRAGICESLARHLPGAEIYCHHTTHPDAVSYDLPQIRETFDDGVARAAACDLLIAYCPSASMGTAIEMYEAYRGGAIVVTVSPMARNWVLLCYSHAIVADLAEFEAYLGGDEFARLAAANGRVGRGG